MFFYFKKVEITKFRFSLKYLKPLLFYCLKIISLKRKLIVYDYYKCLNLFRALQLVLNFFQFKNTHLYLFITTKRCYPTIKLNINYSYFFRIFLFSYKLRKKNRY